MLIRVLGSDGTEEGSYVERILGYVPSRAPAIAGAAAYIVMGHVLMARIWFSKPTRAWWAMAIVPGAMRKLLHRVLISSQSHNIHSDSGAGFSMRAMSAQGGKYDTPGLFIFEEILIIVNPMLFLVFNYQVFKLLITHALGPRHALVKPNVLLWSFVGTDIIIFGIQVCAGTHSYFGGA
jgi:hypothetical protein